jgi:hypothetical protein
MGSTVDRVDVVFVCFCWWAGMKGLRFSFGKFDNTWLKMGFMTKGWIWRLPPWCLGFAKVYTWRKSVIVYCIYSGVHFSHKWFETHSCFFLFPKLWCFYYIPVMTQRLIILPLQKATAPASIGPRVPHSCPSLMFVLSSLRRGWQGYWEW